MKALRVTLAALFVFASSQSACNRKPEGPAGTAEATPAASLAQPQEAAPVAPTGDALALLERGREAYRANRDEEAIEHFRRAAELSPDFAEAHYRLGLAYNATKQTEEADKAFTEAVKAYQKIIKEEPKNSDAYYFLGISYENLGKYDEAVKALKESVKNAEQESDDKYYELASAHYKIAQYDESVKALNKTLEINPDHFPAQELLEAARNSAKRVAELRKRQEQLRRQQNANANADAGAANSNSGANTSPGSNTNAAAPPA
jgi:tetratricopeptide (TPR) repeat protein